MFPLVQEMAAAGAPIRVPVTVACRVLGFSKQAYYQWLKHPVSAREREQRHLIVVLRRLHDNDEEGGYRVLADDIRDLGYEVSERRVWRLCQVAGIRSTITSRKTRYRSAGEAVGDDLIARNFTAEYLDEKWHVDITEHWTTWIPAVVATRSRYEASSKAVRRSAGVSQSRDFRGRSFSSVATSRRRSTPCGARSVPLGKYCRRSPLVFSLLPRCQGDPGSAK